MADALAGGVRLFLLSAPAGYGKTTTVSAWVARRPQEAAGTGWLSLDEEDNDETLFWSYIVAALEGAHPAIVRGADVYLESQPLQVRGLLTHLLNRAAAMTRDEQPPAVLVLDDYHRIANPAIHEGMRFFLEHLPPQLAIVIITRSDPPLPVALMRARGEARSLRAETLRFSPEEVAAFLDGVEALNLSSEQVDVLAERTEGWAAGLQMAALALESVARSPGGDAVATFVETFGGTQRYILDYLLEEILARQPQPLRRFLLQTSILDRLSAGLCAAVIATGDDGSLEADARSAAATLDYLDRANLFLVQLDQQRRWYRYHHLFADLLRARLQQQQPQAIAGLHRHAARWYREQGLAAEAIGHALEAGDRHLAANLLEAHTRPLLIQGQIHALLRSIRMLPADLVEGRPWLAVYQAWALTLGGHYEEAATLVAGVEQQAPAGGEGAELRGHLAAIRAFQAGATTAGEKAVAAAREALALLPPDAVWPRGLAEWSLGYAYRMRGRLAAAVPHFQEVIRLGHSQGDLQAIASAQYDLALIRRRQGQLRRAEQLLSDVLALAQERGGTNLGYLGRVEAGLAGVLLQQNRLREARTHLARSLHLNEDWQNPNHDARTYLVLAQLELAEGNRVAAAAAWREADSTGRQFSLVPVLTDIKDALQLDLWRARGELAAAATWLADHGYQGEGLLARARTAGAGEETLLAAIRVYRDRARRDGRSDPLPQLQEALALLLVRSQENGAGETQIAALMQQALVHHLARAEGAAFSALQQAVTLAAPEGYVRLFLDEGPPMQALLARLAPRLRAEGAGTGESRFLQRLLAAFAGGEQPADAAQVAAPAGGARPAETGAGSAEAVLLEPLTERELEVLALLAAGFTNQQIAERLFIARGTVKAHAASIYSKLDVHNRTRAVARARELGLL